MPRIATPSTEIRFDVTLGHRSGQLPELAVVATRERDAIQLPLPGATFRTFADLRPTAEAIRGFATKFGWLTAPQSYDRLEGYPDAYVAEPVAVWEEAITRVGRWVAVWEAWHGQDLDAMARAAARAMEITDVMDVAVTDDPQHWDAWLDARRRRAEATPEGLQLSDGAALLAMGVTSELDRLCAPTRLILREGPDGDGFALETRALSLLGSIWLQFARALEHGRTVRPCDVCSAWMEIGQGGYSKNRQFCSNRCKLRSRQEDAV